MSLLRCPEQRGRDLLRELWPRATEDRDARDGCSSASASSSATGDADLVRPQSSQPDVPNYLVPAILTTVFCCLPFGIVSIVYAAQVNGKVAAGDRTGALESSRNARMWAWISFGSGLVLIVGYLIVVVVGAIAQS